MSGAFFMAEIKTYAENYNIPLQEAYKQRRPLFLGNVASTQDIDTLIARAKEEAGLANFNKDAVERENALYQQQEAEAKLQEEIKEWENKVDKFESGELNPRKPVIMLRNTPLVLTLLGADKNLTISTEYETLNKVLRDKHKLPDGVTKQIPQAMTDPIMIFKSATVGGDFVMMLELKDQHEATVVVPVSLKYDGLGGYTVNYVSSIYGQKNTETNKPRNHWFINQIEQGNLVYQNNKKSRKWSASSGLQLPRVGQKVTLNGKIQSILTENDLSRAKQANPTFYQDNSIIQGSITPVEGAKSIIRFFQATDISTGFHEFGHYMRFAMKQKADLENARTQDIKDWKKACEFVGAKDGEIWTREQEEKFTDAVMEYLHTGEAPSKGLKRVFANIARWLTKLYQKVSRSGIEISPEMKAVFDRQLATEKEILAARQKIGISEVNSILTNIQESDLSYLSDEERERYNALVHESDIDAYSSLLEKKGRELEENRKTWKQNAEIAFKLDRDNQELAYIMDKGGIYLSEDLLDQYQISLQAIKKARPFQYNKIFTADKSKSVDIDIIAERFGFEGNGAIADLFGQLAAIPNKQTFINNYMAEQELLWRQFGEKNRRTFWTD